MFTLYVANLNCSAHLDGSGAAAIRHDGRCMLYVCCWFTWAGYICVYSQNNCTVCNPNPKLIWLSQKQLRYVLLLCKMHSYENMAYKWRNEGLGCWTNVCMLFLRFFQYYCLSLFMLYKVYRVHKIDNFSWNYSALLVASIAFRKVRILWTTVKKYDTASNYILGNISCFSHAVIVGLDH